MRTGRDELWCGLKLSAPYFLYCWSSLGCCSTCKVRNTITCACLINWDVEKLLGYIAMAVD